MHGHGNFITYEKAHNFAVGKESDSTGILRLFECERFFQINLKEELFK